MQLAQSGLWRNTFNSITKTMSNASTYEAIMINSILVAITVISVHPLVRNILVVNDRIPTDSLRKNQDSLVAVWKEKNEMQTILAGLNSFPSLSSLHQPCSHAVYLASSREQHHPKKLQAGLTSSQPWGAKRNFFLQHPETLLPGKDLIGQTWVLWPSLSQ